MPAFRTLFAGKGIQSVRPVASGVRHVLSHRVVHADCYAVELSDPGAELPGFRRILAEDFDKFPVSRLVSRFFSILLKPINQESLIYVIE